MRAEPVVNIDSFSRHVNQQGVYTHIRESTCILLISHALSHMPKTDTNVQNFLVTRTCHITTSHYRSNFWGQRQWLPLLQDFICEQFVVTRIYGSVMVEFMIVTSC